MLGLVCKMRTMKKAKDKGVQHELWPFVVVSFEAAIVSAFGVQAQKITQALHFSRALSPPFPPHQSAYPSLSSSFDPRRSSLLCFFSTTIYPFPFIPPLLSPPLFIFCLSTVLQTSPTSSTVAALHRYPRSIMNTKIKAEPTTCESKCETLYWIQTTKKKSHSFPQSRQNQL